MAWEQFIYGHFNGYGMCLSQTKNVPNILTEQSLHYLYALGKHYKEEDQIKTKFPSEQIVAYSFLKPISDEHGRQVMRNHTILVSYDDIFTDFEKKVEAHFIRELDKPPENLKPIMVNQT